MPEAARDVEQFLYHEARLLDQQRYEDWLALYTEDATYWVPLEQGQNDALETSSIIRDDRTLLELRVRQARHPRAFARQPLARTVHQVGNVMVGAEENSEVDVASTLQVVEYRAERQRLWGATVLHRLRRAQGGWMIASKRVDLVNSEAELDGIAILF
jgi:3-phenylpropionate/cinnamic acid dioxygenase small subunit